MEQMELRYTAIIVLYNKKIENSITCKCINKIAGININIIIVDNSETDQKNESACQNWGYQYLSMNGNKGLSKAYNAAIDTIEADIVILFDDDTNVTAEYFRTLNDAVIENPNIDIFAPIVYGQDGMIYSPNEFNFLKNHFISSPDQAIDPNKFNAIASCLAIRMKVFKNYRFNELLFVDQVDQYFFYEQRKLHRTFMKLDTIISQNFYQRGTKLTAENGWRRMKLRIKDIMRHAKLMGGIRYKVLGFIKCCGLSIQIGRKSRSLSVCLKGILLSIQSVNHFQ